MSFCLCELYQHLPEKLKPVTFKKCITSFKNNPLHIHFI